MNVPCNAAQLLERIKMNFEEAIKYLINGYNVSRKLWTDNVYLVLPLNSMYIWKMCPYKQLNMCETYLIKIEDILADDWYEMK